MISIRLCLLHRQITCFNENDAKCTSLHSIWLIYPKSPKWNAKIELLIVAPMSRCEIKTPALFCSQCFFLFKPFHCFYFIKSNKIKSKRFVWISRVKLPLTNRSQSTIWRAATICAHLNYGEIDAIRQHEKAGRTFCNNHEQIDAQFRIEKKTMCVTIERRNSINNKWKMTNGISQELAHKYGRWIK